MAALNQAEELSVAASGVSYAARPLLEFYSLSQAGRAIAAAHLVGKAELIGPSAASYRRDQNDHEKDDRIAIASPTNAVAVPMWSTIRRNSSRRAVMTVREQKCRRRLGIDVGWVRWFHTVLMASAARRS
jgi:hypothetical protein